MNRTTTVTLLIILAVLIVGGIFFLRNQEQTPPTQTPSPGNNSSNPSENAFPNTSSNPEFDYSLSYPNNFTELAVVEKSELSSLGYIPPCVDDYNTCLYYDGTEFEGTNFDSAGLSLHTVADATQETCNTFAGSYTLPNNSITTEQVGTLTFYVAKSGDAGAGHVADETLYRTFHNNTCYELVARIGYTQFGNYPAGSIKEFTNNDRAELSETMKEIVHTLSFF